MSDNSQKSGGSGLAVLALLIGAVALAAAGASLIMLTQQLSKANIAVEKSAESRIKSERQLLDMQDKLTALEERLATADRNRQSLREQVLDLEEQLHSGDKPARPNPGQGLAEVLGALGAAQAGGEEKEDPIGEAIGEAFMKGMAGLIAAGQNAQKPVVAEDKPPAKAGDFVDEKGRPTMTRQADRQELAPGVPDLD